MANCKSAPTSVDNKQKLSFDDGKLADDATFYRSITGALQYLTLTRPDIAYAVNQACLYMHSPRTAHWNLVKRILRYLRGTINHGLVISASPSTDLKAYSDEDWGGCPDTRRSTSGYCVYLGDSLISWSSKRQPMVARSSAEAEYRGVANAAAECCWLRNLLQELHVRVDKATMIYCDNVSARDVLNRIGDIKALGSCALVSRRFHALVLLVDSVFIRVDCVIPTTRRPPPPQLYRAPRRTNL
ncbi:secreted RxLR effector protein 161-like [Miscanthus floridulus]|uniref:secreted RxLR effector protein 161-like n=1 Tax=Miscanthus floridulus TaxID=154761 RepID=UPI00345A2B92